jgi:hypothetical protein
MSVSAWPTAVAVAVALVASVAYGCTSTASTPADAGDSDSGSSTALDGALDVASLPARPLVCPPSAVAFQPTAWPIPSWFDGGFPCANNQDLGVVLQCLILLPSDPRCPELMANTGACSACVLPPEDASFRGALIREGPLVRANTGGCVAVALHEDVPTRGCGYNINALEDCTAAACAGCAGHGSLADYAACTDIASLTVCAQYTDIAMACYRNLAPGSTAARCDGPGDFFNAALNVAEIMCAPPEIDAGIEAGIDDAEAGADGG